jgi:hypothetical protein
VSRRHVAALLVVAAVAVAGCGSSSKSSSGSGKTSAAANPNAPENSPAGDIPDNQAYVPYTLAGGHFSVKVPEGWAQSKSGGAVTFAEKLNSVRMESAPASGPLTVAAAQSTEVPKLKQSTPGFAGAKVSSVTRPAGTAVRITYLASSKPDPVTGKATVDAVERYVFFHNGRRAILTLTGAKSADNVDPWKIVSSSLRWTA